jgi:predicted DNA-binding protein (MmcQ/YjbR family)
MITREEILEYVSETPGTVYDKPFSDDFDTTVLRHKSTKKWFGILLKAPGSKVGVEGSEEVDVLNLKCDPTLGFGLKSEYRGIVPAYHMNKYHWISVILDSDVPFSVLKELIELSFSLTMSK